MSTDRSGERHSFSARLLGVDPGSTTGLFLAHVTFDRVSPGSSETVVRTDFHDWQLARPSVADVVRNALTNLGPVELVVVERYVITQRTARLSQQPAALEVTGLVKQLADDAGVPTLEQSKSNAAKLASDDVLKSIGWHARGRRHANDAARHVLLALAGHNPVVFESLMTYGRVDRVGQPVRNEDTTMSEEN